MLTQKVRTLCGMAARRQAQQRDRNNDDRGDLHCQCLCGRTAGNTVRLAVQMGCSHGPGGALLDPRSARVPNCVRSTRPRASED